MRTLHITLLVVVSWSLLSNAQPRPARTFDAYMVDVEGGEATLFVSPSGESLLVDTGWPGFDGRDADRIAVVAKEAFIANLEEGSPLPGASGQAPVHMGPAHWIKLAASADGSFSVTSSRTGLTKRYEARR
jgi:hypothetical protein